MSRYFHSEEIHNLESPREAVSIILEHVQPKSILDVGCGIGTWLKAFEENGVIDVLGLDGDHVDQSLLKISKDKFVTQDLEQSWNLYRKFDLVVSLEVVEHLDEKSSDLFVEMLTNHGDAILFSAAVPNQGGQNHLNEQWPVYWQEKFMRHGFYFHDTIRPYLWNNPKVQWWYCQNMFLITREVNNVPIMGSIHPRLFEERMNILESTLEGSAGVKESFQIFIRSLRKWTNKKLGN